MLDFVIQPVAHADAPLAGRRDPNKPTSVGLGDRSLKSASA